MLATCHGSRFTSDPTTINMHLRLEVQQTERTASGLGRDTVLVPIIHEKLPMHSSCTGTWFHRWAASCHVCRHQLEQNANNTEIRAFSRGIDSMAEYGATNPQLTNRMRAKEQFHVVEALNIKRASTYKKTAKQMNLGTLDVSIGSYDALAPAILLWLTNKSMK